MLEQTRGYGREERYSSILNHAPTMVAYIDKNERYQFSNDKYCQFHRMSASEMIGRTLTELLDIELAKEIRPRVESVLRGEKQLFEVTMKNAEGENLWVEAYYVPDTGSDNEVRGFFAFIRDIHDRKTHENSLARFKYAVDQGTEGFALHDEFGNFTYLNSAQLAMYGFDAAEVLGQSWKLFYSKQQADEIENIHFPKLIDDGKWRGELVGRKKDGTAFDVEVSLTLLIDTHGAPAGLVCNCQDITQRKIAEQSLRHLHKMDAVGQLTGGVAHDFNNILAVIIGNLDLLRDRTLENSEDFDLVQRAIIAAEKGSSLTNRLLAFSRNQTLQPKLVNISRLVEGMDDFIRRSIGENVEISIELETAIWMCEVDPSELENAILNLALNARDAMPDGGDILIKTKNLPPYGESDKDDLGDGQVMLSVTDTGTGMTDDVQQRLFDPFFTTKDVGAGTGLGLSMVHGFVSQSGGYVEVLSELGEGTTIELYLPRSTKEAIDSERRSDKGVFEKGEAETILVVEDDPDVRQLTVRMLKTLGYNILEAADGLKALELLSAGMHIDLLLSDVVLPRGLNGPQIAERVRQILPDIKILFMSGYTESVANLDIRTDLIPKPFVRADLAKSIRQVLGSKGVLEDRKGDESRGHRS
jgi:PAS domain S-box-containing protein